MTDLNTQDAATVDAYLEKSGAIGMAISEAYQVLVDGGVPAREAAEMVSQTLRECEAGLREFAAGDTEAGNAGAEGVLDDVSIDPVAAALAASVAV